MDQSKDKIKAALLGELIRYMGKSMVSSLADPEEKDDEYESEAPEAPEAPEAIVAVATPEEADSEEMDMDEKKKRMHKLKKMAEEC